MADTPAASAPSIAWRLTPEQLVAACEAVQIAALPGDVDVEAAIERQPILLDAGRRSLQAARLLAPDADADAARTNTEPALDPALGGALGMLVAPNATLVADLWCGDGARHSLVAVGTRAAILVQDADGSYAVIACAVADAAARFLRAAGPGDGRVLVGGASDPRAPLETLPPGRWERLVAGGALRTSDGPLARRAAAAGVAAGVWQLAWLRQLPNRPVTGESIGWVIDDDGIISVDAGAPDDGDDGELTTVLRAAAPLSAPLAELWAEAEAATSQRGAA